MKKDGWEGGERRGEEEEEKRKCREEKWRFDGPRSKAVKMFEISSSSS